MSEHPHDVQADDILGPQQMADIRKFLLAPDSGSAASAWPDVEPALHVAFDDATWGVDEVTSEFSIDGRPNLYRAEMQKPFRDFLDSKGIGEEDYSSVVLPVQYNSVQIWLRKLFTGQRRSNQGWRIRLVGFPSIQIVAVGLASNYQGTQNQNTMGAASAMLRKAALDVLAENADARALLEEFPSASSEHWDGRGLMPSPVLSIGSTDISDFDEAGAQLKFVRNTTVKKEIATFFFIKGLEAHQFEEEGPEMIAGLQSAAFLLGQDSE